MFYHLLLKTFFQFYFLFFMRIVSSIPVIFIKIFWAERMCVLCDYVLITCVCVFMQCKYLYDVSTFYLCCTEKNVHVLCYNKFIGTCRFLWCCVYVLWFGTQEPLSHCSVLSVTSAFPTVASASQTRENVCVLQQPMDYMRDKAMGEKQYIIHINQPNVLLLNV